MTNAFLKRRGRGGGHGCWRREVSGLWTSSSGFCWASGPIQHRLSMNYIHACTQSHKHTSTHTHTHLDTRTCYGVRVACHGWCVACLILCDVSAGCTEGTSLYTWLHTVAFCSFEVMILMATPHRGSVKKMKGAQVILKRKKERKTGFLSP